MDPEWLPVDEAARRLGVKPATLYAYVSRGQLRRRVAADGRRSEYRAADVAGLAVRGRRARPVTPTDIVVPTAITAIRADGPAYRGRPAVTLAGATSFEAVAAHLWGVAPAVPWRAPAHLLAAAGDVLCALPGTLPANQRLLPAVAAMRVADPLGGDLRPAAVVGTATALLATLVEVVAPDRGPGPAMRAEAAFAARLAATVAGRDDPAVVALLDAALVLLADHELAPSTLAVRVAASARSDPYAAVLAGLAVHSGRRHGAASLVIEQVLHDVSTGTSLADALAARIPEGSALPGFGHPLYPDGDPRAARLLGLVREGAPAARWADVDELLTAVAARGLPPPNVDVALGVLTAMLGAPRGTGELVFALARVAGWIAHALEQYADPKLLRPSAVYTGP